MSTVADAIAAVRTFAEQQNISPSKLAKMANLHPNTLRGFQSPNWNPTTNTLSAVEVAIKSHLAVKPKSRATIRANLPQCKAN